MALTNGNLESVPNKNISNGHAVPHTASNGKPDFYQTLDKTMEDSYSTTRHRAFVGFGSN